MRWLMKTPKHGDCRVKDVFLLIPMYLEGEWRWLEKALVFQQYQHQPRTGGCYSGWVSLRWGDWGDML